MRLRLRELGITLGRLSPGPYNSITDVPGIRVGHTTVVLDEPRTARTGVTVIVPAPDITARQLFAGSHSFNGNGEMTGLLWVKESGLLGSVIGLTNTHQVGLVRDSIIAYESERRGVSGWMLPVVSETYDGYLNDIDAMHVTREHVYAALDSAAGGPVAEGNVGSGTGMICHGFKGGIGTASRLVESAGQSWTVGVLVQANYGLRAGLRLDGIPIGLEIDEERVASAWPRRLAKAGSIVAIVATDAPLLPGQCSRLAQRATVGLARTGGAGYNSSGDLFFAFSTGNRLAPEQEKPVAVQMLPNEAMDGLFDAVAESVEEAIWNALTRAETMKGVGGHTAPAIPLDAVQQIWKRGRLA